MAVTIDHQPLPAEQLGLETVGQVLAHIQNQKRFVVQVLIDGQQPELRQLDTLRQVRIDGHSIYIETADPRRLALDVLDEVESQLQQADPLKSEVASLFQQNQPGSALEKLQQCLRIWQDAQQAIAKTAELLRLDLQAIRVDGQRLSALLQNFANSLKEIRSSLRQRDYVLLSDILLYELADSTRQWLSAARMVKQLIQSLQ